MNKQLILCCFFFFLASISSFTQPDWRDVVSEAFLSLDKETKDSIASCRSDSDRLRKAMNKIVQKKSLDPDFIFGPNDEYYKEGMHKNFKSAPQKFQQSVDRDKDIVRLEQLHIKLYYRDKTLYYWQEKASEIEKYPERTKYSYWENYYNRLAEKSKPKSNKAIRKWVKDRVVCRVVKKPSRNTPLINRNRKKVGKLSVKFSETIKYDPETEVSLPISNDEILCSLPTNGQFAFHVSESKPGIGYICFASWAVGNRIKEFRDQNYELKTRWISSLTGVQYTDAEFNSVESVTFFKLPKKLEAAQVYQLQLIAVPKVNKTNKEKVISKEQCWDTFRQKKSVSPNEVAKKLQGELLVTELYFRAGKYEALKKADIIKGTIEWEKGLVVFETDEPFDAFEMYGQGSMPPNVNFSLGSSGFYKITSAINSKEVLYYLSVPRVENLDGIPATELVAAELDNTLEAAFIRDTKLGNVSKSFSSRNTPEDIIISPDYIAPAFSKYNIQDSLFTPKPIPHISKAFFESKKEVRFSPMQCSLKVGEIQQLYRATKILHEQLNDRLESRVNFFYELEKRKAERAGTALTISKDAIKEKELENLPPRVKELLDLEIPSCFENNFTIDFKRSFPGTETSSTIDQVKFFEKDE